MKKIIEALKALDPQDDTHWTADGLPRVDVVEGLVGEPVTRQSITDAVAGFTRSNPVVPDVAQEEAQEDPLVQIEAKIAELDSLLAQGRSARDKWAKYVADLSSQRDLLLAEKEKMTPKASHIHSVKAYLSRNEEQRERRAEIRKQLVDQGVNLRQLQKMTAPAPIDQRRR